MSTTVEQARDALWKWFAFAEWEDMELDVLTDEQDDRIETAIRDALAVFCEVIGHNDRLRSPDGPYCVLCWQPIAASSDDPEGDNDE